METIKGLTRKMEARKKKDDSFSYGFHPERCDCGMFNFHDGRVLTPRQRLIECIMWVGYANNPCVFYDNDIDYVKKKEDINGWGGGNDERESG